MKIRFLLWVVLVCLIPTMKGVCSTSYSVSQALTPERAKQSLMSNREHVDLLNYLIVTRNYKSYLEIGVADGKNFGLVMANRKVSVDPSPASPATYRLTSDDFFSQNRETFDLIFIDGLHHYDQVLKDVENALQCLNPGGLIVMHDCMPQTAEQQSRTPIPGAWNGDVWKAAAYIRMHLKDVGFCVLDMDWGCGILTPNSHQTLFPEIPISEMDWNYYVKNKRQLLNVKSVESWLKSFR